MGENSKIEWCDHTFNPVIGCTKVSPGCKHCYAEQMMANRWHKAQWGPQARRIRTSSANWRKPLQWDASAKADGRRARVFCASLADVFEDHKDWVEPRRALVVLMEQTPNLQWLLLTKRPENVMRLLQATMTLDVETWFQCMGSRVWIGASVEQQATADTRISALLKIPAQVRFLSCEPLLGPLDLDCYLGDLPEDEDGAPYPGNGIQWVIAGGESGAKARPMEADWVRSLRDQCQAAGTAFFFKQWGAAARRKTFQREQPVGRLLDGREWNEFPRVEVAYEGA